MRCRGPSSHWLSSLGPPLPGATPGSVGSWPPGTDPSRRTFCVPSWVRRTPDMAGRMLPQPRHGPPQPHVRILSRTRVHASCSGPPSILGQASLRSSNCRGSYQVSPRSERRLQPPRSFFRVVTAHRHWRKPIGTRPLSLRYALCFRVKKARRQRGVVSPLARSSPWRVPLQRCP
jgi:hypothetical protein